MFEARQTRLGPKGSIAALRRATYFGGTGSSMALLGALCV